MEPHHNLVLYKTCLDRINNQWPLFIEKRNSRLPRGDEPEKTAEAIIEDLLTSVLDWEASDVLYQHQRADIILCRRSSKHLVIETKRPNSLRWSGPEIRNAMVQARRYADAQHIGKIAVTDGCIFYCADIEFGGLTDRVMADLSSETAPEGLWWISPHGIYRPVVGTVAPPTPRHAASTLENTQGGQNFAILHPKYQLPAWAFAWVGDTERPATWKLPYLNNDGTPDLKRLPKAIQAVLTNYRGANIKGISERDAEGVLMRLARAAQQAGRLPAVGAKTADVYHELSKWLAQNTPPTEEQISP